MPDKLSVRSTQFRDNYLLPSGGWLGELTATISELTGFSEILIFAAICSLAWIVLRTSWSEISIILAFGFDLVIPLQYANEGLHKTYLERYWPLLTSATLIEGAAYFLLLPDLFNMAVCIKTLFTTYMWMKDKKPYMLTDKREPPPPADTSSSAESGQPGAPTPPKPPTDPSGPAEPNKPKPHSKTPPKAPATTSGSALDPRFPNARKDLAKAGYTDPQAQDGMIQALKEQPNEEKAAKSLKSWLGEKDPKAIQSRMKRYKNEAAKASGGAAPSDQNRNQNQKDDAGDATGGGISKGFSDKELRTLNQEMKDKKMDDKGRRGIIQDLKNPAATEKFNKALDYLRKNGFKVPDGVGGGMPKPDAGSGGTKGFSQQELEKLNQEMKDRKVEDKPRRSLIQAMQNPADTEKFNKAVESLRKSGFELPAGVGGAKPEAATGGRIGFSEDQLRKLNQEMKVKGVEDTQRHQIMAVLQDPNDAKIFDSAVRGLQEAGFDIPAGVGGGGSEPSAMVQLDKKTVDQLKPKLKETALSPDEQAEYLKQLSMPMSKERFAKLAGNLKRLGLHVELPTTSAAGGGGGVGDGGGTSTGFEGNIIKFDQATVDDIVAKLRAKGVDEDWITRYTKYLSRPTEELELCDTVAHVRNSKGVDVNMPGSGFINGSERDFRGWTEKQTSNILLDELEYILNNEYEKRIDEKFKQKMMNAYANGYTFKAGDDKKMGYVELDRRKPLQFWDAYPGRLRYTIGELRIVRRWLEENLRLGNPIHDAMLLQFKNQTTREQAEALWSRWKRVANSGAAEIVKLSREYANEVPEEVLSRKQQAAMEAQKAQKARERR